jgi:hypothetical protein
MVQVTVIALQAYHLSWFQKQKKTLLLPFLQRSFEGLIALLQKTCSCYHYLKLWGPRLVH